MKMTTNRKAHMRNTGLTLIEVLIVVVILIIGILTVIQLFPAGFNVLRAGQDASAADRLASAALQSMRVPGAGVPDGIYAGKFRTSGPTVTSGWMFDPTIAPDDLAPTSNIAKLTLGAPLSDVDKVRYIKNETFTVPVAGSSGAGVGTPIHFLNFGPILVSDENNPVNDIDVKSAPWTALTGDSTPDTSGGAVGGVYPPKDPPADTLLPGGARYMIDYANGMLAVAPEKLYTQTFVFIITPVGGSPVALHITVPKDNGLASPLGYDGTYWFDANTWKDPADPVIPKNWVPGTDELYRPIVPVAAVTGAFDANDPYQYRLVNHNITTTTPPPDFNVGALEFNSAVANQPGTQALKVRVSYQANDWHILHQDLDVPAQDQQPPVAGGVSSNNTVRLAIDDIKEVGDTQADGSVYTGIVPNATLDQRFDFIFADLDTGKIANYTHADVHDADVNQVAGRISVSFKNGRITFPPMFIGGVANPTGAIHHLRAFYEGKQDWAVAVQKSPTRYINAGPILGATASPQNAFGANDALTKGALNGLTPNLYYFDSAAGRIYFPLCDEGKSIELDNVGISYPGPSTVTGSLASVTVVPTQSSVAPGSVFCWVDLTQVPQVQQLLTTLGGTTPTFTIGSVGGISARAIVIWRDGHHWRKHTLDTMLPHS